MALLISWTESLSAVKRLFRSASKILTNEKRALGKAVTSTRGAFEENGHGWLHDEAWSHFSGKLNELIKKHIPMPTPIKNGRRKIWMTGAASAKFRKKQRAWKQYQNTKNYMDYVRAPIKREKRVHHTSEEPQQGL